MGLLFAGRIASFLFTFAIPVVLTRIFSRDDFGLYKQLFLLHGTLIIILSCGLPWSLYYFIPGDREARPTYTSQAFVLLCLLGLSGFGGLVLQRERVAVWLNNVELVPLLPALGLFTALACVGSILEIVMITTKRADLASATIVVSEILKSLLIIGPSLVARSVGGLMIGMVGFGVLRVAALIAYLRSEGLLHPAHFRYKPLFAQLGYSLPFGLAAIIEAVANSASQYYVAALYDPGTFAVFAVGCVTVPLVPLLFDSVSDVSLVRMTEHVRAGAVEEVVGVLSDGVRKLWLVCIPLFVFLEVVAHEFVVTLFTSKFEDSVAVFRVFMLSVPLTALSLEYVPRAFAETRFLLRLSALRAACTFGLLVWLTQRWGPVGAALASVGGMGIARTYAFVKVRRLTRAAVSAILPWKELAEGALHSLLAGAATVAVRRVAPMPPAASLVLSSIIFSAVYLALTWNSGLVNEEEKGAVTRYVRRIRKLAVG